MVATSSTSIAWSAPHWSHVPPSFTRMWTWRFRFLFSGAERGSGARRATGGAGWRRMGAPRGVAPPPHRTHSGQTAAKSPPTLGRSSQTAASRGLAAVTHVNTLAARVAGKDAPALGGCKRPQTNGGGADGEGGSRQRQGCEWAGPGAVA